MAKAHGRTKSCTSSPTGPESMVILQTMFGWELLRHFEPEVRIHAAGGTCGTLVHGHHSSEEVMPSASVICQRQESGEAEMIHFM